MQVQLFINISLELCGHPSYVPLDLAQVRRLAEGRVPEDGVLPELATQLEHGDGLDKVLLQKASTPHAVAQHAGEVFEGLRPHAVLLD